MAIEATKDFKLQEVQEGWFSVNKPGPQSPLASAAEAIQQAHRPKPPSPAFGTKQVELISPKHMAAKPEPTKSSDPLPAAAIAIAPPPLKRDTSSAVLNNLPHSDAAPETPRPIPGCCSGLAACLVGCWGASFGDDAPKKLP